MNAPSQKLCMIIGDPIAHSLSPLIHTTGYRALRIDSQYSYTALRVTPEELADFMNEVRETGIRGISCTSPHKITIMAYLDEIDGVARKIGAVNSVVNNDGELIGYNTDWLGVVQPLEKLAPLSGKHVAMFGAGGAARAIAYGITNRGGKLTIYNRTLDKAKVLADELGATAASLSPDELAAIKSMDIIINASSVGMRPDDAATPVPRQYITNKHIVFDAVYVPYETRLLREAAEQGAQVIHGTEMLLQQGVAQFKLYTGYDAPVDAMRKALNEALAPKASGVKP